MNSRRVFVLFLMSLHIVSISSLPKEPRDVAIITTIPASEIFPKVAKYTSYSRQYFAVARPSQLAAMSSYDAVEDSLYAVWASEGT